ncbi:MAG: sulfur oxidation c-type cytochrome SoxX [Hylemonella sp.]|nr:sulfur oxidation c-type cytochrome SoxX [Hylemonella sp.]
MKKQTLYIAGFATLAAALVAGCSSLPSSAELDKMAADITKASFRDQGQAKVDRLVLDDANLECMKADVAGKPIDEKVGKAIEEANFASIKWPAGGQYIGDWKEGEKIAQSGRGMTWSDAAGSENGGNCYNCHQISKEEISFGTLGPSLYNYGKIRGVSNLYAPESAAIVQYTWGKIWNARAYSACSQMPRAGHKGVLTEQQVKHIMALLLDPKSPVNQ